MISDSFDYENCWTLSGTLHTATPKSLIACLRQQFPLSAGDEERETKTLLQSPQSLSIYLRQDALLTESALAQALLAAAPDTTGTLILEWPYFENHEQQWPTAWRFHGPKGINQHDYALVERATPTQHWDIPPSKSSTP